MDLILKIFVLIKLLFENFTEEKAILCSTAKDRTEAEQLTVLNSHGISLESDILTTF